MNTLDRLADKFLVGDGCWEWTAAKQKGYGAFYLNGKVRRAHRVVYELLKGSVSEWSSYDDPEFDHLCRNRACVRPDHLELVPHKLNCERTPDDAVSLRRAQTHCKYGHELSGYNLLMRPHGRRGCRQCGIEAQRRYQDRKRGL